MAAYQFLLENNSFKNGTKHESTSDCWPLFQSCPHIIFPLRNVQFTSRTFLLKSKGRNCRGYLMAWYLHPAFQAQSKANVREHESTVTIIQEEDSSRIISICTVKNVYFCLYKRKGTIERWIEKIHVQNCTSYNGCFEKNYEWRAWTMNRHEIYDSGPFA